MAKTNWSVLAALAVVCLLIGGAVGAFGFSTTTETEKIVIETVYKTPQTALDLMSNMTIEMAELQALVDNYEDEYEDDINERNIEKAAKEWVLDNYIDELELDDDDYEDMTFDIVFDSIDADEKSNDDWVVELSGMIDFFDEDGLWVEDREFEAELEYEEDGDLDDFEIDWA